MPSVRIAAVVLALAIGVGPPAHGDPELDEGPVTVFLDRNGEVAEDGVRAILPRFGGGDVVWSSITSCVRRQFAPFRVRVVEWKPMRRPYIHVHVGGLASMKGLDDLTTNGISPHDGTVIRDADVYVFSQVGSGERDSANLCRVATHEIGHALGLDHELQAGDVMSYLGRSATLAPFALLDVEVPCGESTPRPCFDGSATQSSYRKLVRLVGLEHEPAPIDPYRPDPAPIDPYTRHAR
ncbi:MAG TPA: matrixin family metalloprotease [Kofleriaceae bacterium]|nr:matrixin family metalloprotease [Kofleriaceae bacterium]